MKLNCRIAALKSSLPLLLLLLFSGCLDLEFEFATFSNPSVAPSDAKVCTELFGSFIVEDSVEPEQEIRLDLLKIDSGVAMRNLRFLHVGRAEGGFPTGFLHTVFVDSNSHGELTVDDSNGLSFASKLSDLYILNCPIMKPTEGNELTDIDQGDKKIKKWIPEDYEGYMLLIAKPTKAGFTLHLLNEEFLKSEIAAKRLAGKFMSDEKKIEYKKKRKEAKTKDEVFNDQWTSFVIEAKSKELQEFFMKNEKDLVGDPIMTLKRVQ